jgi:hypothetical protein
MLQHVRFASVLADLAVHLPEINDAHLFGR